MRTSDVELRKSTRMESMESDTAPLRGRNNSMPKGYIVFAVVTGLLAVAFIITYFVVDENINNGLKGISEVPPP
jgi:hypothetical protein